MAEQAKKAISQLQMNLASDTVEEKQPYVLDATYIKGQDPQTFVEGIAPTKTGGGASGTWGINITGRSSGVTGTVSISNGGTGGTNANTAMKNLIQGMSEWNSPSDAEYFPAASAGGQGRYTFLKLWNKYLEPKVTGLGYIAATEVDTKLGLKIDKSTQGDITSEDTQEVHINADGKLMTKASGTGPKGDKGLDGALTASRAYSEAECLEYCTAPSNHWSSFDWVKEDSSYWVTGKVLIVAFPCTNGDIYVSVQQVTDGYENAISPLTYWIEKKGNDGLTTSVTVNGTTYNQLDGNITLPNYPDKVSHAIACGSGTMNIYPKDNNVINFGGTGKYDTIYIGYSAEDNKPVPKKIIFGGANGSTELQAATVTAGLLRTTTAQHSNIKGQTAIIRDGYIYTRTPDETRGDIAAEPNWYHFTVDKSDPGMMGKYGHVWSSGGNLYGESGHSNQYYCAVDAYNGLWTGIQLNGSSSITWKEVTANGGGGGAFTREFDVQPDSPSYSYTGGTKSLLYYVEIYVSSKGYLYFTFDYRSLVRGGWKTIYSSELTSMDVTMKIGRVANGGISILLEGQAVDADYVYITRVIGYY